MFIVLEGVDGSGKSTQIANLQRMFAEQGISTEYLHFPRFDAPYFGELIARFLRGELGSVEQVDPYIVAMLYAGDRRDAAAMIRGWMAEGKVVLCDRYVYSNIGYHCAKVADAGIATVGVTGTVMTVTGVAEGFTTIDITVDGKVYTVTVTVRDGANSNGWM